MILNKNPGQGNKITVALHGLQRSRQAPEQAFALEKKKKKEKRSEKRNKLKIDIIPKSAEKETSMNMKAIKSVL